MIAGTVLVVVTLVCVVVLGISATYIHGPLSRRRQKLVIDRQVFATEARIDDAVDRAIHDTLAVARKQGEPIERPMLDGRWHGLSD